MSDSLSLRSDIFSGIKFERNRLVLPAAIVKEEIVEITRFLISANNSSLFWLGDWMLWIAGHLSTEHAHEVANQSDDPGRLFDAMKICSEFQARFKVSYSHHREAYVEVRNTTEASKWLALAESEGWTVSQMRAEIRSHNRVGKEPINQGAKTSGFSLTGDLSLFRNHLKRITENHPIDEWTHEELAALYADLAPVRELIEEVESRLESIA
jgi:hypothetical protein